MKNAIINKVGEIAEKVGELGTFRCILFGLYEPKIEDELIELIKKSR